jgi:hypothetical protein
MALAMHFLGFLVSPSNFMNYTVQTLKFCDKIRKVNQRLESQTPPYLPNGDSVGELFYIIGFRTLENGGVGHLQILKKKTAIRSKCPSKTKTPNLVYLENLTLLNKNNSTTSFKTHENGGVGHFKTFNMYHN